MKYAITSIFFALALFACTSKKRKDKDSSQYFPVRSYVQSQVKSLDTASYSFIKIEAFNGKSDTTLLGKEELKQYTKEFTDIPDLTDADEGNKYNETKSFDSLMGRVFMSYTATEDDMEVTRQEITVLPTLTGSDEVKTIYVEKLIPSKDGTIEKKMLWETGYFFTITTITSKGNSDQVHKLKVLFKKNDLN